MQPTWQTTDGAIRLFLGDALEILPTLEPGCIDAVVTDPPFGVRGDDWDNMDAYEFARFSMAWMSAARLLAAEFLSFGPSDGCFRKVCELLFPYVRQLIWDKPLGSQYAGSSERGMWFAYEPVFHCYTSASCKPKTLAVASAIKAAREIAGLSRGGVDMVIRGKKTGLCYRWEEAACLPTPEQADSLASILPLNGAFHGLLREAYQNKSEDADRRDVFSYRTEVGGIHPCEKPVELMEELLSVACSQTIIDPFMGSGTTIVAAVRTGRRAIGIEREPPYFWKAVSRIEAELNRNPLFEEPPQIQRSLIG